MIDTNTYEKRLTEAISVLKTGKVQVARTLSTLTTTLQETVEALRAFGDEVNAALQDLEMREAQLRVLDESETSLNTEEPASDV